MTTAAEENATQLLEAKITPEEMAMFEQAAGFEGVTLDSFVVTHLREHSQRVIQQHGTKIRLNEEESRRFVEVLQAPPREPTPEMKAAVDGYYKSVTERWEFW